jgi:arylsulfatase A-like enzyme
MGDRIAVRQGDWEFIVYNVNDKEDTEYMLFDLSSDVGKTHNLVDVHPYI